MPRSLGLLVHDHVQVIKDLYLVGQETKRAEHYLADAPLSQFKNHFIYRRAQPILPGTARTLIGDRPPFLRQSKPFCHPFRRLSQLQLVRDRRGEAQLWEGCGPRR